MGLPFMNLIAPPRPGEKTKLHPKRSWKRVAIGAALIAVAIFVYWGVFYANWFREGPVEASAEPIQSTEVTAPAPLVVEPESETNVVAEPPATAAPTTTVSEVTTTIFLPNVDREELGLLEEGTEGRLGGVYQAFLSGVVLSVEEEEVTLPWEDTPIVAYVLYVDLGDHQETGETVIGRKYLAAKDHPTWDTMAYCRGFAGGTNCSIVSGEEVPSLLKTGRQYDFYIVMEIDCDEYPEELQENCLEGSGRVEPFLVYNRKLVSALKGGELPDPDGLGLMGLVEIPPGG